MPGETTSPERSGREVEFLMTGVDGPGPQLYFTNTMSTPYHYDLATEVLGTGLSLEEFNGRTYFRDDRQNLAVRSSPTTTSSFPKPFS